MNEQLKKRIDRLAAETLENFYCDYCFKTKCGVEQLDACLEKLKAQLTKFAEDGHYEKV